MDRLGSDFGAYGDGHDYDDDAGGASYDDSAHSNPPPSPVGQDERRMQVRAYNHWSSLLGDQDLPHIEDLEPEFLGDFGPYSVLFDFSTGSTTPTLQFIGKELARECRQSDIIETLQEIPEGSLLSRIAENYLRVVEAQGPVSFAAENPNAQGQKVAYRGVLLPYSSDHDTIDFVYAVINWKEVADAATADALLAEIDRAMDFDPEAGHFEPTVEIEVEPVAEPMTNIVHFQRYAQPEAVEEPQQEAVAEAARASNILAMRTLAQPPAPEAEDLPAPSFGTLGSGEEAAWDDAAADDPFDETEINDPAIYEAVRARSEEDMTYHSHEDFTATPKRSRMTDALGNPIGGALVDAGEDEGEDHAPVSGGITTAADYGLPEWEEDEPEAEDVDDVVNPLADIDLNSRLLSLVNAGTRGKKTVDLATLCDLGDAEDGDDAGDDKDAGKLLRAKAPPVDSLLTPEPYMEDFEAEEPYTFDDASPQDEIEQDPRHFSLEEDAAVVPVAQSEWVETVDSDAPMESDFETAEPSVLQEPAEAGGDVFDAALELGEDDILEELPELEGAVAEEGEAFELGEEFAISEEDESAALKLADDAGETAAMEEPSPVALVAAVACEPAGRLDQGHAPEQECDATAPRGDDEPAALTGLLAAVRDLTEAARMTQDPSRRALYEAVGKAFDVSIKAVIASEQHARTPRDVVQPFPLEDVSRSGPDMALVMVRRHANGDTEVLGEVPHDVELMETAQRRLARQ